MGEKTPENFAEFYQEMKLLMEDFKKKQGDDFQAFRNEIEKKLTDTGKKPEDTLKINPTERHLFDLDYSSIGILTWTPEQRAEFENSLIIFLTKYRLYQLTVTLAIKKQQL